MENQKWLPDPYLLGAQKTAEVLRNPCILGGPQRQARGENQKWLPRVLPKSPMRCEHFEYTHTGGLSNFSACRMPAKKFSAHAAPPIFPKISMWRKTGLKTLGDPEAGGEGGGSRIRTGRPPRRRPTKEINTFREG